MPSQNKSGSDFQDGDLTVLSTLDLASPETYCSDNQHSEHMLNLQQFNVQPVELIGSADTNIEFFI